MSDTDRTDIIPGLRPDSTPPLPLLLPGAHRRRRRNVPRWAWTVIWGVPAAVVAGLVGLSLGGPSDPGAPVTVVSPSPTVSEPSSLEPAAPLPVPSRSRADRSRPRTTETPAPSPKASRRSSSPTPTPTPTPTASTPRTSPPPASPSPTGTGSSGSPTPTNTTTLLPAPEVTG